MRSGIVSPTIDHPGSCADAFIYSNTSKYFAFQVEGFPSFCAEKCFYFTLCVTAHYDKRAGTHDSVPGFEGQRGSLFPAFQRIYIVSNCLKKLCCVRLILPFHSRLGARPRASISGGLVGSTVICPTTIYKT